MRVLACGIPAKQRDRWLKKGYSGQRYYAGGADSCKQAQARTAVRKGQPADATSKVHPLAARGASETSHTPRSNRIKIRNLMSSTFPSHLDSLAKRRMTHIPLLAFPNAWQPFASQASHTCESLLFACFVHFHSISLIACSSGSAVASPDLFWAVGAGMVAIPQAVVCPLIKIRIVVLFDRE